MEDARVYFQVQCPDGRICRLKLAENSSFRHLFSHERLALSRGVGAYDYFWSRTDPYTSHTASIPIDESATPRAIGMQPGEANACVVRIVARDVASASAPPPLPAASAPTPTQHYSVPPPPAGSGRPPHTSAQHFSHGGPTASPAYVPPTGILVPLAQSPAPTSTARGAPQTHLTSVDSALYSGSSNMALAPPSASAMYPQHAVATGGSTRQQLSATAGPVGAIGPTAAADRAIEQLSAALQAAESRIQQLSGERAASESALRRTLEQAAEEHRASLEGAELRYRSQHTIATSLQQRVADLENQIDSAARRAELERVQAEREHAEALASVRAELDAVRAHVARTDATAAEALALRQELAGTCGERDALGAEVDHQKEELTRRTRELREVRAELDAVHADNDRARQELAQSAQQAARAAAETERLLQRHDAHRQLLSELQVQNQQLAQAATQTRQALEAEVAARTQLQQRLDAACAELEATRGEVRRLQRLGSDTNFDAASERERLTATAATAKAAYEKAAAEADSLRQRVAMLEADLRVMSQRAASVSPMRRHVVSTGPIGAIAVAPPLPAAALGGGPTSSHSYAQHQQQEQTYSVGPAVQMRPQQPVPRHGATGTVLVGINGTTGSRSTSYADASSSSQTHSQSHQYHHSEHHHVPDTYTTGQRRYESPGLVQIGTAAPMTHRQLMSTPTRVQ